MGPVGLSFVDLMHYNSLKTNMINMLETLLWDTS